MKRRQFLAIPALALLTDAVSAADGASSVEFTREAYEQALASGEPFMLDFYASW